MRKLLKMNKLRDKAWKCFSNYIRYSSADNNGIAKCITCGVKKNWKQLHSGHFIHGHNKLTFFMPENVHPQCVVCNLYKSGNLIPYYEYMANRYGQAKIEEIKSLSHKVFKPTRDEYDEIIHLYGKIK